jgi:hypothetical protein
MKACDCLAAFVGCWSTSDAVPERREAFREPERGERCPAPRAKPSIAASPGLRRIRLQQRRFHRGAAVGTWVGRSTPSFQRCHLGPAIGPDAPDTCFWMASLQ